MVITVLAITYVAVQFHIKRSRQKQAIEFIRNGAKSALVEAGLEILGIDQNGEFVSRSVIYSDNFIVLSMFDTSNYVPNCRLRQVQTFSGPSWGVFRVFWTFYPLGVKIVFTPCKKKYPSTSAKPGGISRFLDFLPLRGKKSQKSRNTPWPIFRSKYPLIICS